MESRTSHQVDSHRTWIGEFAKRVATSIRGRQLREAQLLITLAVLAAPRSGLVLIEKSRLAWILAVKPDLLDPTLASLAAQHLVRLMESGPYLVISLKYWSGIRSKAERENPLKSEATVSQKPPSIPPPSANASPFEKNYSNDSRATARAERHPAERARGDGVKGLGSGEEDQVSDFVRQLSSVIDEPAELEVLRAFCNRYDQSILTEALERLRKTPRERIRKSPAALFTYLVKTIYHERNQ